MYEVASTSNHSNMAPIVAFQSNQENADPNEPSSSSVASNVSRQIF